MELGSVEVLVEIQSGDLVISGVGCNSFQGFLRFPTSTASVWSQKIRYLFRWNECAAISASTWRDHHTPPSSSICFLPNLMR